MPDRRGMTDKRYHTRNVLTVDKDAFDAEFARHGANTIDEIATLLFTDPRTVRRIRNGTQQPSTGFHANCLAAGVNFSAFVASVRADQLANAA